MITALMIAVLLLTALLFVSLPWNGWGSGMDAAGRGMAMFFPMMFMGLRLVFFTIALIVLAAGGGFAWTGLPAWAAAILAIALICGMGGSSFFSLDKLNRAPRAEGRARFAFLAAIAAPLTLVLWILAERYGPTDPAQAWAVRALVLIVALVPIPMGIRIEREEDDARRAADAKDARAEAEADTCAAALPAGATLAEILRFHDTVPDGDWRLRGRIMQRAVALPDTQAQLRAMLAGSDWADKIAAGFHSTFLSPQADASYFALAQPIIAEIVQRLQDDAAPPATLYRETSAALRLAWPAMHTTALPKALMQALYDAVLLRSETDASISNLQHDVKLLAELVQG